VIQIDAYSATGIIVGKVIQVRNHPNGEYILLADVDYGHVLGVRQIVFGGKANAVSAEAFVAVAPPTKSCRVQNIKMRRRKFRNEFSYGELCSFYELGLTTYDTDQVAIMHEQYFKLTPGASVDDIIFGFQSSDDIWKLFKKPL
jgi:tRNA-binding EMAP/Myf-like protein